MITPRKNLRLEVLARHTARLDQHMIRLARLDQRFFWLRLASLIIGFPSVYFAFSLGSTNLGWITALAAAGIFALIVSQHRKLDRARLKLRLHRDFSAVQIARMQLDWKNLPPTPDYETASDHHFAADLDLVGNHSLLQLIDISASAGGSERLLNWLLDDSPDFKVITQRQVLVSEILPLAGLRHQMALRSRLVTGTGPERWNGEQLVSWLQKKNKPLTLRFLVLVCLLAVANYVLFILDLVAGLPAYWVLSLGIYGWLYVLRQHQIGEMFDQAYYMRTTLEQFRMVLAYLEKYPFPPNSSLRQLTRPFWQAESQPSHQFRIITAILAAAGLRHNPFIWAAINTLLPWDFIFAYHLERHKQAMSRILPTWLDTWYELEALNSLSNFAYLNPEATFPEITLLDTASEQAVFTARAMGHPLIPDATRVCNDFHIVHRGQIFLISGSNMSGKSTFLRTLGTNLRLAYAGCPVIAARLQTIPFRLFTSLNIRDSLSNGISLFYAEVKRLKALLIALEADDAPPVFFLIDEIFRGTNNLEREIGSRAYIHALAKQSGVGCIATHDLALVHLADEIPGLHNYHFKEEILDGQMVFDYTLRPGPCPTTNALKIMQLEGLPVPSSNSGQSA